MLAYQIVHFRQLPSRIELLYSYHHRRVKPEFVGEALPQMKNPYEVLRSKEQELIRIRKEMDALRIAARLLDAEDKAVAKGEPPSQLTRVVEMP